MKLKLATIIALIGTSLNAIYTTYISLYQFDMIAIHFSSIRYVQATVNIVFALTVVNFFISFLIAQKKRG